MKNTQTWCSLQQEIEYSTTEEHNPFGNRIEHKLHPHLVNRASERPSTCNSLQQEVRKQRTQVHQDTTVHESHAPCVRNDNIATGRAVFGSNLQQRKKLNITSKIAIDVDEIVSTIGQAMLLWNPVFENLSVNCTMNSKRKE